MVVVLVVVLVVVVVVMMMMMMMVNARDNSKGGSGKRRYLTAVGVAGVARQGRYYLQYHNEQKSSSEI